MDLGRRQNADPRWILPLLCRRGHITRNEIGAIRIGIHETHFQVPRAIAARFADAVARTASGSAEDGSEVRIEVAPQEGGNAGERHVPRSDMRSDAHSQPQQKPAPVKRATLAPSSKEHVPQAGGKRPGPNRGKPGRPNPHKPKNFRKPG
jgi:ATP-dependent RNA helicase DeaD